MASRRRRNTLERLASSIGIADPLRILPSSLMRRAKTSVGPEALANCSAAESLRLTRPAVVLALIWTRHAVGARWSSDSAGPVLGSENSTR